jgi:hypothetical protein
VTGPSRCERSRRYSSAERSTRASVARHDRLAAERHSEARGRVPGVEAEAPLRRGLRFGEGGCGPRQGGEDTGRLQIEEIAEPEALQRAAVEDLRAISNLGKDDRGEAQGLVRGERDAEGGGQHRAQDRPPARGEELAVPLAQQPADRGRRRGERDLRRGVPEDEPSPLAGDLPEPVPPRAARREPPPGPGVPGGALPGLLAGPGARALQGFLLRGHSQAAEELLLGRPGSGKGRRRLREGPVTVVEGGASEEEEEAPLEALLDPQARRLRGGRSVGGQGQRGEVGAEPAGAEGGRAGTEGRQELAGAVEREHHSEDPAVGGDDVPGQATAEEGEALDPPALEEAGGGP